jgi:hypothetical protein
MNSILHVPGALIDRSLELLREAGKARSERVIFWLGKRQASAPCLVEDLYLPVQEASRDYFHLPASSMTQLMGALASKRLALLAQIHSHPGEAFHSEADDRWAVVRHRGALSIVIPEFASGVTVRNFNQFAAVFRLSAGDDWELISADEHSTVLHIL